MFNVTKSSGIQEPFSYEKYHRSLLNSGLSEDEIQHVFSAIKPLLHKGISTQELYEKTYDFLKKIKRRSASLYSLKNALRELGPTGFPFEQLVGKILEHEGYSIQTDITMQGKCVSHEIDVLAQKNDESTIVECKFHNLVGTKSDVRVTLYVRARYDDIAATQQKALPTRCMLVTNTQFTTQAIQYGECANIKLLAWGYPYDRGIEKLIDHYVLYPITVLTDLKKRERELLLNAGIVLCSEFTSKSNKIQSLGISADRLDTLTAECTSLANSPQTLKK
jgi:Holliday junction resolvase-like predicted endonuclease